MKEEEENWVALIDAQEKWEKEERKEGCPILSFVVGHSGRNRSWEKEARYERWVLKGKQEHPKARSKGVLRVVEK